MFGHLVSFFFKTMMSVLSIITSPGRRSRSLLSVPYGNRHAQDDLALLFLSATVRRCPQRQTFQFSEFSIIQWPNPSPEPMRVGAGSSAVVGSISIDLNLRQFIGFLIKVK
jgi:hypothetical protein